MSKKANKDLDAPTRRGTRFVPAEDVPEPGLSPRAREVVALALCGFSLYALLSMATFRLADVDQALVTYGMQNLGGAVGYYLSLGFTRALGLAGWIPFLLLLAYAMLLFLGRSCSRVTIKLLGAVVFAAMMAILFAGRDGLAGVREITPYGAGGVFGAFVSPKLDSAFGGTGRLLLVGFGALVSLLLATEWMFSQLLLRAIAAIEPLWQRWFRRPAAAGVGGVALGADEDAFVVPAAEQAQPGRRRRAPAAAEAESEESDESEAKVAEPAAAAAVSKSSSRRSRRPAADEAVGRDEVDELAGLGAVAGVHDAEPADEFDPVAAAAAEFEPDEDLDHEVDVGVERASAAAAAAAEVEDDAAGGQRARVAAADEPAESDASVRRREQPPELASAPEPVRKPVVVVQRPKPKKKKRQVTQNTLPFQDYPFPPIELFQEPQLNDLSTTAESLQKGGEAIVNKLANFNIESEIVAASVGPAVTQYELRVAESIRVNRVAGFESDLAAALKAISVRVVAPIPGKDTIGIEVPNEEREKVFMRDLLDQFGRADDQAIPLFLGKDVAGTPIVEDLARMPHLLIAGTTGSGKSVCINTILLSILMTRTPQQVQLILVDPKMVELQAYKQVPHLCCDVVTNMKKASGVLQWAVDEMENRYALLSVAGVNHIKNYNRLGAQELARRLNREPDPDRVHLPYIVIVIDEFADLMNVASNEVEELIQRLAQKSRAVGMHVILATQRPSSEIITGVIKANLPCQIAFKVNRRIDSRVILDANGAEKLLGFGDMLYMPPSGGALLRAQGTYVSDDELQAVVRYLEAQGQKPSYNPALVQTQSSSRPGVADRDERYREAVEVVLGQQRGSATLLQRALSVGYSRATRLLELMEEDGLVGPFVGSKSRDVLLTLEEYHAREEATELAAQEDGEEEFEDEFEDDDDAGPVGAGAVVATTVQGAAADDDDEDDDDEDDGADDGTDDGADDGADDGEADGLEADDDDADGDEVAADDLVRAVAAATAAAADDDDDDDGDTEEGDADDAAERAPFDEDDDEDDGRSGRR